MDQLISMDWVTILSIILSVTSIVLAIVSIAISIVFYKWSKDENERTGTISVTISEKVACLEKLFDKMYASTYDMVLDNSRAMQRQLFPGAFESPKEENKDLEVFCLIDTKKRIPISEVCSQLSISKETARLSISKMINLGRAQYEMDGEIVVLVERENESTGSSDDDLEQSA